MVELGRGNAEVEQDAVRTGKTLPFEDTVDVAEVALDGRHASPYGRQTGLCVFERFVIAVDADQTSALPERRSDAQRMTCAAGRRVHIDAVRLDVQSVQTRLEQNGNVMKFHRDSLLPVAKFHFFLSFTADFLRNPCLPCRPRCFRRRCPRCTRSTVRCPRFRHGRADRRSSHLFPDMQNHADSPE